ncbi:MAG: AbrB/MazE/SpoVT family DNA-binding domain-containing protein [Campylobacteraceae bacterium]|jgi:AbrB family looped-hinge helix DNA binding protein|nr:AbrB/MazE/SpoVT family DNA-binding domain-containing protein [Campylobacteraceae bacterium]
MLTTDSAKVMSKGQVTLPKEIRKAIGVGEGDRVIFIRQGEKVILMNSTVYAMKIFQKEMDGEAEKAGIYSDDDVINIVMQIREENKK